MPPRQGYDPIGTVQQAITALLNAHEPEFLGIGLRMFMAFATIMLAWYGIRMMLAPRQAEDHPDRPSIQQLTLSGRPVSIGRPESGHITGT